MSDWKLAEEKIRNLLKGNLTVGSGCSWQKGDVQNKHLLAEVKQSEGPDFTIKREWLDKVYREAQAVRKETAICFFVSLRGVVYYPRHRKPDEVYTEWSTLTVKEENFPSSLVTENLVWELEDLSTIRDYAE